MNRLRNNTSPTIHIEEKEEMKAKTLIEILTTRIRNLDGNPTKKRVTEEVIKALEKLMKYEEKYGDIE